MYDSINLSEIFSYDSNFQTIMANMLQTALDVSFQGVMITEAEPGYPIIYVNQALCDITGYTPQEFIGQSPSMLQGEKSDPEVLKELYDKLEKGEIFHGKTYNYRKDGTEFLMEWKIVPIRGVEGEVANYLAIQREVSDGKLTDGSLDTKLKL
jgi:PAS domain S-box-containing protein